MTIENIRPVINSDIDHLEFSLAPKWLLRRKEINANDKLIYIRIRNCTSTMGEYFISHEYLVHECGIPLATVKRSINRLISFGLISKKRHGKKMFNGYQIHQHEWMSDDNKFAKSDSSKRPITESDSSKRAVVIAQNEPSIYKEQNKKQNILSDSSNQTISSEQINREFEAVWRAYPNRTSGKQQAFKAYQAAVKQTKVSIDQILNGISKYTKYVEHRRANGFSDLQYKLMATWIRGREWESDYQVASGSLNIEEFYI